MALILSVDIVSDAICPWCFIGKRRLAKALALLADRFETCIKWLPFQLNPDMLKSGMERKVYRAAKFGNGESSQSLDAKATAVGATEGIAFAFDRIRCTPNTFDAHRLIWLAQQEGQQDAIVEALFQSYFEEGKDMGDRQVLTEVAGTKGLDAGRVK